MYFIHGIALIGVRLEVEYNRINLGGSTEYLGWIKGTIAAWSVEEQDVRLFE